MVVVLLLLLLLLLLFLPLELTWLQKPTFNVFKPKKSMCNRIKSFILRLVCYPFNWKLLLTCKQTHMLHSTSGSLFYIFFENKRTEICCKCSWCNVHCFQYVMLENRQNIQLYQYHYHHVDHHHHLFQLFMRNNY